MRDFFSVCCRLAVFIATACGPHIDDQMEHQENLQLSGENRGLFLAAVDQRFSSSQILYLDLMTDQLKTLSTGESGDPALFQIKESIALFNRTPGNINLRYFKLGGREFKSTTQVATAKAKAGDPHAVVSLPNGQWLLAHHQAGVLGLFDPKTGANKAISATFVLPADAPLKPESLVQDMYHGHALIAVVHQGYQVVSRQIQTNDSQQVFIFEFANDRLTPVDLKPKTPSIDGIKLTGSFPVGFPGNDHKMRVFSLCSRFVAAADKNCHAAIEEIDFERLHSKTLWDLAGSDYYMNGPIVQGESDDTFYVSAEQKVREKEFSKVVVRFDIGARSVHVVHRFPPESGGFYAVFYDRAAKRLLVGDSRRGDGGEFTVYKNDRFDKAIPLPGIPYSGVIIN